MHSAYTWSTRCHNSFHRIDLGKRWYFQHNAWALRSKVVKWERPCTNICTCSKFLQNAFTVWNKVWTVWNKTSTKSQSRKLSLWQQFYGLIMFAENTITDSSYLFQSPYVNSWIDILIPVTYSNHITSTHAQIRDNKLWTWEFGVILHEKTSKTQLLANGHMLQWISGCFHIQSVPGQTIASVITKP